VLITTTVGIQAVQLTRQPEAVGPTGTQVDVAERHLRRVLRGHLQRVLRAPVLGGTHPFALDRSTQQPAQHGFIVNH
jgi:hypothetical protein